MIMVSPVGSVQLWCPIQDVCDCSCCTCIVLEMHVLVETSIYVACYSHRGISMYVLWLKASSYILCQCVSMCVHVCRFALAMISINSHSLQSMVSLQ